MPASTATASNGRVNLKSMVLAALRNVEEQVLARGFAIPFNFGDTYSVATTSLDDVGDIVRLFQFPGGAYINQLRVTATDMDTNATPTLQWDVVVIDSADTVKATLIANSTSGQAGGTAVLDNAAIGEYVGDYWLALKLDAVSATPAAGTVKVFTSFSVGLMNSSGNGNGSALNPRTTDAAV